MSQVSVCPHCGASDEYVAQFRDQQTRCSSCNRAFSIHTATAPPPLPRSWAPTATLPGHFGSAPSQAPMEPRREGNLLVVPHGAILPCRCVKCNKPATEMPARSPFYWHEPWVYSLLVVPLSYIIVAIFVRRAALVRVHLCRRHRIRRQCCIVTVWIAISVAIAMWFVAGNFGPAKVFVPLGIVILLGGSICGAVGAHVLASKYIDDRCVWLKGACPEFLASLPPPRGGTVQQ